MPSKVKKPTVDVRPGEVVAMAVAGKHRRVFLANPLLRRAAADQPGYALRPGVPTILPAYLFSGGRDGQQLLKSGHLELVEDGQGGVLPEVVDLSDTSLRAELRDGVRPGPTKQQVLEDFRQRYGEWSLGAAVLLLVEHGWSEKDAASVLVPEHVAAFQRRDGSVTRESWVRLAEKIVENGGVQSTPER